MRVFCGGVAVEFAFADGATLHAMHIVIVTVFNLFVRNAMLCCAFDACLRVSP
jgi:hypothetical protein